MAHALQDRFSKLIDAKLRATLVTKDNYVFNTRHDGSPKAGAVKIPVRDLEVEVKDYDKGTGAVLTTGTTTYITVAVTKDKAVNEIIDGYVAEAVPDNMIAERLDSGAYSLGLTMDQDGIATLETQGTAFGTTTALTKATVYGAIVDMRTALSSAKVPTNGRFLIVSPEVYGLLLQDSTNFIKQSDLSQELVMAGAVGRVAGFTVFESVNMDVKTEMIGGHPDWCHRIEEWSVEPTINNLTNEFIGSSAVQGRKVFAHKVSKPLAVQVKVKA